jgi:SAM-dependent methyltransferase
MSRPRAYPGSELELFSRAVNWKDYLRARLARFLGREVLEVGAGIGATTKALCGPGQQRWVCLEPDADMAGLLRRRVDEGELPACCEVLCGTTAELPPGARFDTILYIDVLEHIRDDAGEVRRAARVLAPGGHLAVLAPAHPFLFTEFDRAIGHHRRYGRSDLLRLAPPELDVVEARYLDSVGLAASLGNRFLLRSATPSPRQIQLWDRVMVPISRLVDPLVGGSLGKSVLVAWRGGPGRSRDDQAEPEEE